MLVFFGSDERMTLGISAKVPFRPVDGRLMPAAWYIDDLDDATERGAGCIIGREAPRKGRRGPDVSHARR